MSKEKLSCISYAIECLEDLYRNTSKDGFFYITAYDYYMNDCEHELECSTRFTKKEFRDSLIGISYDMYAIETIGNALHDKTYSKNILEENPILSETCYRLLEPFDYPISTELLEKAAILDWEDLTEEEQKLYSEYRKAYKQDCVDRVGEGMEPNYYVTRSKRILKLLELGTPDIIVKNEIRCYVIAYVLFHYGRSVTDFSTYQLPSLGLTYEEKEAFRAKVLEEKENNRHKIDKSTLKDKNAYIDQMAGNIVNMLIKYKTYK